ncbi:MAG: GNAT family N-acetyltransferase [Pseudomonadota bacterium]
MNTMDNAITDHDSKQPTECEVYISTGVAPEDVESLLDMTAACAMFNNDELSTAEGMVWDCAYQGDSDACRFIQARINTPDGHTLAGFLCYGSIPQWPDSFELIGISVTPRLQRQGIGSAMLAEMERQVAARGGMRILIETESGRTFEAARTFYEATGYDREDRFLRQFIPKEGGVVYRKDFESDAQERQAQ